MTPVSRRRKRKAESNQERSASFTYHVLCYGERVKVCQKAFISLHGISEKRVVRLRRLLMDDTTPKDKRGKHPNTKAVPVADRNKIHDHILLYPVKESHYSGKSYQYLDARLTIKAMYDMFKEKHPESNVKYHYYRQYFNEHFELSFGRPQVDTCITCEELKLKLKSPHLNDVAKRVAAAELLVHKRRAGKFYTQLKDSEKRCQENDSVHAIAVDFMQNLPLPHIPVQSIFYLRQLWVNVCCIYDMKTNKAHFCVYHEGVAKKGANEVCSFILAYINENIPSNVKELHVFSDGCVGQNKNHSVIRTFLSLTDTSRFDTIIHRFPIRGHSFLPCDRVFGTVKRKIKKVDRIYTPMQYVSLILHSSEKSIATVKMVDSNDIQDFSSWWPTYYKRTTLSMETMNRSVPHSKKVSFKPTEYMEFTYSAQMKGCVVASSYIGSLVCHTFKLSQPGVTDLALPHTLAYPQGGTPINIKKLADIQQMLPYIPQGGEEDKFYQEILRWNVDALNDISDDD